MTNLASQNAEQQIRLQTKLLGAVREAIIATDRSGTIIYWNPFAEELYGWAASEVLARNIMAAVMPADTHQRAVEIMSIVRGGGSWTGEFPVKRKDGTIFTALVTDSPILDEAGQWIGIVGISHDLTERKQAEEALRRAHDELEERVKERTVELERQVVERQRAEENLRELTGRLLHLQDDTQRRIARELHDSVGQLLAALGMNIALVSGEKQLSAEAAKAVSDNAALVEEISREVRTISHLLHPPLLDEVGLLGGVRLYLEEFAQRSGMKVDLELAEDFGRLSPDLEMALFRVIQECLINIHRHSGSPTATIRISRASAAVRVEVQDQGRGIPQEKLTRMESAGSGVGLRGMRERVRQLGGELTIRSGDRGTLVIVRLPLRNAASG